MTLAFKTELNGAKTLFMEKILRCDLFWQMELNEILRNTALDPRFDIDKAEFVKPKHHTIRRDEKNRWQAGRDIHFVVGNRTKKRLQFAPVVPVISTQKIEIIYCTDSKATNIEVRIDNVFYADACMKNCVISYHSDSFQLLAQNDGFDSVNDFLEYFSEDFTGKIIHWTDLTYKQWA